MDTSWRTNCLILSIFTHCMLFTVPASRIISSTCPILIAALYSTLLVPGKLHK